MSEVEDLAAAILAAGGTAGPAATEPTIFRIGTTPPGQVMDLVSVTVQFPAGQFDCRWTGAFRSEVLTAAGGPQSLEGAKVLVTNGVVIGSIYPRSTT